MSTRELNWLVVRWTSRTDYAPLSLKVRPKNSGETGTKHQVKATVAARATIIRNAICRVVISNTPFMPSGWDAQAGQPHGCQQGEELNQQA